MIGIQCKTGPKNSENNEHYIKIKEEVRGRLGLFEVKSSFSSSLAFMSLFGLDDDLILKYQKQYLSIEDHKQKPYIE